MRQPVVVMLCVLGASLAACLGPTANEAPAPAAAEIGFGSSQLDATTAETADAAVPDQRADTETTGIDLVAIDVPSEPNDADPDADTATSGAETQPDVLLVADAQPPDVAMPADTDVGPVADSTLTPDNPSVTDTAPPVDVPPPVDAKPPTDAAPGTDTQPPPDTATLPDAPPVADATTADISKADVPPAPVCGNSNCESSENCAACPKDCGCGAAMLCKDAKCVSNWPPPPMPANCTFQAKVLTYNPKGWGYLGQALADDPAPCADYYIHLPAIAGDKTQPRGEPAITEVHAYGSRFHALAEFHWGGWSDVAGMTWLQKGKEFRKRMVEKGYVVGRDHWAINELPSSVRTDKAVRQAVRDVVKGLYEGPTGAPAMGGAVYIIGMGQATQNFAVYKPNLKDWTLDSAFWQDMNAYVKWWGQEVYGDPATVCVGSATVAQRSEAVNMFAMHHARLAQTGPAGAAAAKSFFDESYTPLGSAFWRSSIFNTEKITLDQMKHFASTSVYAARAWAANNPSPDARIALAWNNQLDGASEAEVKDLAARVASALRHAYDVAGPPAAKACSPSGAYTWCACSVGGAAFNGLWKTTFAAW